jgi:hypothetical protein
MLTAASGPVVVQHDIERGSAPGAIQPQVRFRLRGSARLPQDLQRRFIRMDMILRQKPGMEEIVQRNEPPLTGGDQPIGHRLPRQVDAPLPELFFLPVERQAVHVFLMDHVRQHGRRRQTARQRRGRHGCGNDRRPNARLLATAATVHVAHMLDDAYLRRNDLQFPPHFRAHRMQRPGAVRADAFRFVQRVVDRFDRQVRQFRFPFAFGFLPPLDGHRFDRRLGLLRARFRFGFVEQRQLIRMRLFAGSAETLLLRPPELLFVPGEFQLERRHLFGSLSNDLFGGRVGDVRSVFHDDGFRDSGAPFLPIRMAIW